MKKIETYEFIKGFQDLGNLEGYEFVKMINRNYDKFKTELEILEKAKNKNDEFVKYRAEVQAIVRENSEKDEKGNPVITTDEKGNQTYSIMTENMETVNKKVKALDEKYADCIEKQKENEDKFIEELNSDVKKEDLIIIKEEHIPKNINSKQMKLVYGMIEWDK